MIRTVALLGLVASASAIFGFFEGDPWKEGLFYKFGISGWGKSSFIALPHNSTAAEALNWTLVTNRPTSSSGYDALALWLNLNEPSVGVLVDEYNMTSGMQISIPYDGLTAYYDMTKQGFTLWTFIKANGETEQRWVICLYFVSKDKETRIASYNGTLMLRENDVTVNGINGDLYQLATNLNNIDSIWTKQACVPLMGLHYYYNMTETLSCDEPFFPWFPIYDATTKQLIGVGLMLLGSLESSNFENPSKSDVEYIVPTCPDCLLDIVENYGAITLHIYFVNEPTKINCFAR